MIQGHESTGSKGNGKSARKIRVAIVDDHPLVRVGLGHLVQEQADMEICAEADDLAGGLKAVEAAAPDVVVVDLSLRSGSGLELIKHIRARRNGSVKILVCSMHDESLYAERALQAGAGGYINKQAAGEVLVAGIRQVARGKVFLSKAMTEKLLQRMASGENTAPQASVEQLSDRELEVFEQIGRGRSTTEIAEQLHLSPKTIESYRDHIRGKLQLRNGRDLTLHAVQWVLESA